MDELTEFDYTNLQAMAEEIPLVLRLHFWCTALMLKYSNLILWYSAQTCLKEDNRKKSLGSLEEVCSSLPKRSRFRGGKRKSRFSRDEKLEKSIFEKISISFFLLEIDRFGKLEQTPLGAARRLKNSVRKTLRFLAGNIQFLLHRNS